MIDIKFGELFKLLGFDQSSEMKDMVVPGFSIDTRTLINGEVFIAIKGERFDGNNFITEAIKKGAAVVIYDSEKKCGELENGSICIKVENTRDCLKNLIKYLRNKTKIPVIAVTGTNGKTTVKNFLADIFSSKYNVLKSEKSYNNVIGVALTMFRLTMDHEIAIFELGTNHPGEIKELTEIVNPTIALITNIGRGHIEAFKNKEGVYQEKIDIVKGLNGGILVLNKDDEYLSKFKSDIVKVLFYGEREDSDCFVSNIVRKDSGYSFLLNGETFDLPLHGRHNVINALGAITVALNFGIAISSIKKAILHTSLPLMRLEENKINDIIFINDSYNANPESFKSAIDVLKEIEEVKHRIVVAGDMLELGSDADKMHSELGKYIATEGIDYLIAKGKYANDITQGAITQGMAKTNVFVMEEINSICSKIKEIGDSDKTVVLLKGSRLSKMEEIIKCFTVYSTH